MIYPNIRAEMGRHDLTIKELAVKLGLSSNSVSFKLNGKREFTLSEIEHIANMFGCSLDYLVGHEVKHTLPTNVENECGNVACKSA
ncbi:helix-turn-helix transcriptional regulator [Blautia coccoides]|uniref:helix-turn-helix domain-containing protein n=1 Tax=Blautia producta TaxID=33035 RepID=UPI0035145D10